MPAPPPESDPAIMTIRAIEVILFAFEPLPGAKFSMCTIERFGGQIRTKRSRRRLNGLAYVVDDALDERGIITFGHDPDQRLGTRLADDQATPALELRLGRGNPFAYTVRFKRCSFAEPDVPQQLRQRLELPKQLACRRIGLDQCS